MTIKEKQTIEYPTRNVAYCNHGIWIEQVAIDNQADFECAVYYEHYENSVYSGVVDAIYIDIISCGSGVYRVNGYAVRPDADRHEIKVSEWHNSYKEAKEAALNWLHKAKQFLCTSNDSIDGYPSPLHIVQ